MIEIYVVDPDELAVEPVEVSRSLSEYDLNEDYDMWAYTRQDAEALLTDHIIEQTATDKEIAHRAARKKCRDTTTHTPGDYWGNYEDNPSIFV